MKVCVVIPHFDHVEQFRAFLPKVAELALPMIVVDDASPRHVVDSLASLLDDRAPRATLIRHAANVGKGGAVMTGLRAAFAAGYSHAVQIDADGQHAADDVAALCQAAAAHPGTLICGQPAFDDGISTLRYYSRYITLYFMWLETMSTGIRDGLCGLRLYPLRAIVDVLDRSNPGNRMAFDPEILVRAVWAGIPLQFVAVRVRYPDGGKSHFRYIRDNLEISWMHTRLIFGMLLRFPRLVRQNRVRGTKRAAS